MQTKDNKMFLLKSCAIFLLSISMINIHAMESSDSSSSSHASGDLSDKRKRGDEEKRENRGIQLSSAKRTRVDVDQKLQDAPEESLDSLAKSLTEGIEKVEKITAERKKGIGG